jgi:hypothetical protein
MAEEKPTTQAPEDMFGSGPASNADQLINEMSVNKETETTVSIPIIDLPDAKKGDQYTVSEVTDKEVILSKENQD